MVPHPRPYDGAIGVSVFLAYCAALAVDVAESVRCVDQVNLLSHALLSSSHIKLRE